METGGEPGSNKFGVEPLTISPPHLSSCADTSQDDVEVAFSEDYVDSPESNEMKSPLGIASHDGSGDLHSDDHSSLGTLEPDDTDDESRGKTRPDFHLPLVRPSSDVHTRTSAGRRSSKDEADEFGEVSVPRRSTSLKTCKTPPPESRQRKKEVRFADALGLDLESVKHIINTDEPPIVPASAVRHLTLRTQSADFAPYRRRLLHPCFSQPGMSRNFAERVAERRVSLQSCFVSSGIVDGVVRVANVHYEKRVSIRYTMNGWLTFTDLPASYIHGSNDGATDQFRFSITLPDSFGVINNVVEFSVRYQVGVGDESSEYWDSNFGANYRVECYTS